MSRSPKKPLVGIEPLYRLKLDHCDLGQFTFLQLAALYEQIGALINTASDAQLTPRGFLTLYCEETNSSLALIISAHDRQREANIRRMIGMALARELLPLSSLQSIATVFNRHHSSVLHACKTIKGLSETEPNFCRAVDALRVRLKNRLNQQLTGDTPKAKP